MENPKLYVIQTEEFVDKFILITSVAMLDFGTKLLIMQCYYACGRSATQTIRQIKKERGLHNDPFSASTVTRLINVFEQTGSIMHYVSMSGRPSVSEQSVSVVADAMQTRSSSRGSTFVRQLSIATGICKSTVYNILKRHLKLYPYKLQLLQDIQPDDKEKRLAFANFITNNADILQSILGSDEAHFSLDGTINRHNCRIWSTSKPNQTITKSLHSPKLTIWMGFSSEFGLKPYFFTDTINANRYLEMLQQFVVPQLVELNKVTTTTFMHDGAPPHFANTVRQYLSDTFGERIIGRGCPIN